MAGEIVHHDDVAGGKAGSEHLFHIGFEGSAVHGSIQDHGRGEAGCPQASDERGGFDALHPLRAPVSPGDGGMQTVAFETTPSEPGHVRLGAGFINKDKPFRLQPRLPIAPVAALSRHIRAFLFRRMRGFFYTDIPAHAACR